VTSDLTISLEADAGPDIVEVVNGGLRSFNRAHAGEPGQATLRLFLRTPEARVVGGCFGETAWQWLYVKTLWVEDEFRGQGCGARLLEAAEEEARRRGCRDAYLATFEFQAKAFYEQRGYRVFGVLDGYPPGFSRFYFRKHLLAETSASE
jgi:GNAT superfamily N-acetyltransferase